MRRCSSSVATLFAVAVVVVASVAVVSVRANHGADDSTLLVVGGDAVQGAVAANESVFYSFLASANTQYRVSLRHSHADGDIDMYLYRTCTTTLDTCTGLAVSDTSTDDEQLTLTASADETLWVRVHGFDNVVGTNTTFTLAVAEWQCTSNECLAGATPLTVGGPPQMGAASPAVERFFRFAATAATEYTVTLTHAHGDGDLDLEVFSDCGTLLTSCTELDSATSDTDNEMLTVVAPATADLWLRVFGFDGGEAAFTLAVIERQCADDDCPSGAVDLVLNTPHNDTASQSDEDYYRMRVENGVEYRVTLTHSHDDGDLELAVLRDCAETRASCTEITSATSGTDNEQLSFAGIGADVWLRVYGFAGGSSNATGYSIEIAEVQCSGDDCPEGAVQLTVGASPVSGNASASDADWFWFEATENTEYTIDCTHTHADGDLELAAYLVCGNTPSSCNEIDRATSSTDNETLTVLAPTSERVWLRIYTPSANAATAYAIAVREVACDGDDCPSSATAINVNAPAVQETASANDYDFYRFAATANVEYRVTLTHTHDVGDLDLIVYGACGATPRSCSDELASSTSESDNESVTLVATQDRNLYVLVFGYDGAGTTPYTIEVTEAQCAGGDCPSGAVALEVGAPAVSGEASQDDADFYVFDVVTGTNYTVVLSHVHDEGDLDMAVYRACASTLQSCTLVNEARSGNDNERLTVVAQGNDAQLWVRVYGFDGTLARTAYSIGINTDAVSSACVDDNCPGRAVALTLGTPHADVASHTDEDWFKFSVAGSVEYDVALTHTHADGDLDMYVYRACGETADTCTEVLASLTITDNERVTLIANATTETLWVRVVGYNGTATTPYTLTASELECVADECPSGAVELTIGAAPLSSSASETRVRYFFFETTPATEYTVSLSHSHDEGDLDLEVFTDCAQTPSSCTLRQRAESDTDNETLNVAAPATGGKMWVRVYGFPGTGNTSFTIGVGEAQCTADGVCPINAAALVVDGAPTQGSVTQGSDERWFFFDATANVEYTLRSTGVHSALTSYSDCVTTATSCTQLTSSPQQATANNELHVTPTSTTRIWVHMNDFDVSTGATSFTIAVLQQACASDDCPPGAIALVVDGPTLSETASENEHDWFAFATTPSTEYTVSLTHSHADGDLDIVVYRDCGATVESCTEVASAESDSDNEVLSVMAQSDDRLWVRVYGYEGTNSTTSYQIGVAHASCADSSCPGLATLLAVDAPPVSGVASEANEQWYRFASNASTPYTVSLTHSHAEGDLELTVYSDCGQTLGSCTQIASSISLNDNESIDVQRATGGDLFARVFGFTGTSDTSYTIAVTSSSPTDCSSDNDESPKCATALILGADALAGEVTQGEVDFFVVPVEPNTGYVVKLTHSHADGDLDIATFWQCGDTEASCTPVAEAESADDDEVLMVTTAAQVSRLWVKVYGFFGASAAYTIRVYAAECATDDCPDGALVLTPNDPSAEQGTASEGDVDWYYFSAAASVEYTVTMTHAHADGDLDIAVYSGCAGAAPTCTLVDSEASADDNEVMTFTAQASGRMWIEIYGFAGSEPTPYTIAVSTGAPPGCVGDDCPAGAIEIPIGGSRTGTASLSDSAWFKFTAADATLYTVSLTHAHADGDLDMELYRACGATADSCTYLDSSESETDNESLAHVGDVTETLWVHIYGFDGEEPTPFTIAVAQSDSACANDSCPPNANAIAVGGSASGRASIDDEDWYKFEATAGQRYTVALSHSHADADLDLELLSDCSATLNSCTFLDSADSLTDDEQITMTASSTGTLWVRVYSFDFGAAAYTLSVDASTTACAGNDCPGGATSISAATIDSAGVVSGQASAEDEDWFRFTAVANVSYSIELLFTHDDIAGHDLDMHVYHSCVDTLDSCTEIDASLSVTDNEQLSLARPTEQVLFVRVYGFEQSSPIDYDLTIRHDSPPTCTGDDCVTGAVALVVNGDAVSEQAGNGDEDWYKLAVTAGTLYRIDLRHSHDDGDLDLDFYSECAQEAVLNTCTDQRASTSLTDDELIQFTPTTGGTAYVRVYGFGSTPTANYTIEALSVECTGDNCPSGARAITIDTTYTDTAALNDPDWYVFSGAAGVEYTVELTHVHEHGDLELILYTGCDGGTLATCTSVAASLSITDNERLAYTPTEPTQLYIEVSHYGGTSVPVDYRLLVSTTVCAANDDNCPLGAIALTVGAPAVSGQASTADADWFVFSGVGGQEYAVDLTHVHVDGDLDIFLYTDCGATPTSCTTLQASFSETDNETLTWQPDESQQMWVEVIGYETTATVNYTIRVSEATCTGSDCPGAAVQLTVGAPATSGAASETDPRWYVFDAVAATEYVVSLTHAHADGDLDIVLLRGCGTTPFSCTVVGDAISETDNESITHVATETEAMWVHVYYGGLDANSATISFTIGVAASDAACAGDDCPSGARALTVDAAPSSDSASASDADWYSFATVAGTSYTMSLTHAHADGDLDLTLYADCGTTQASCLQLDAAVSTSDNEAMYYTATAATTLWLRVHGYDTANDAVSYTIAVTSGSDTRPCPDGGNSCPAGAGVLAVGSQLSSTAAENDEDWYRFSAAVVGNRYTVSLLHLHAQGDLDLTLFRDCGDTHASCTQVAQAESETDNEQASYEPATPTTVWVRVYAFDAAGDVDYQLSLTSSTAESCTTDDCPAGASTIAADGTPTSGTASSSDEDFYQFAAVDGEVYTVALTHDHEVGDLDIILYRGCTTSLQSCVPVAESVTSSDDEHMRYVSGANQTLWVRVYGFGDAPSTDYQLSVRSSVAANVECAGANGTPAGACAIGVNERVAGSVAEQEEDWYVVDGEHLDHAVAHLDFVHADGDVDLYVYHDCGTTLASCTRVDASLSYDDDEQVRFVVPASGRVWLRVLGFDVQSSVDYALRVEPGADGSTTNVGLIVGLVVAALVLLAIVVIVIVVVYKREQARGGGTSNFDNREMEQLSHAQTSTATADDAYATA